MAVPEAVPSSSKVGSSPHGISGLRLCCLGIKFCLDLRCPLGIPPAEKMLYSRHAISVKPVKHVNRALQRTLFQKLKFSLPQRRFHNEKISHMLHQCVQTKISYTYRNLKKKKNDLDGTVHIILPTQARSGFQLKTSFLSLLKDKNKTNLQIL